MATFLDRVVDARRELEDALDERSAAQRRFEAAIGTSTETGAYQRLRRATRRVTSADAAMKRAEAEDTLAHA
jgi:hypothetical protein